VIDFNTLPDSTSLMFIVTVDPAAASLTGSVVTVTVLPSTLIVILYFAGATLAA
jgi:hypothetical protein